MGKKNVPHPGYFKVSGGAVEAPDLARKARQALGREKARLKRRAPGKPPAPAPELRAPASGMRIAPAEEGESLSTEPPLRPGWLIELAQRAGQLARAAFVLSERLVTLPGVVVEHFKRQRPHPA